MLEAFRQGQFDQLEIIGEADEKEFFELCLQEKILASLAEAMPTDRKKEEVPRWFVLAANLSLKLHCENSFSAFERVVRCGGLLSALPPQIASKHLAPKTQQILLEWHGFNDKNQYARATPCDQDFLRKFVRDVPAAHWQAWFNGSVQQTFQSYGFFDPSGIFIGDGSYLFVPDHPRQSPRPAATSLIIEPQPLAVPSPQRQSLAPFCKQSPSIASPAEILQQADVAGSRLLPTV